MSVHHRPPAPSESDALYRPLPQAPSSSGLTLEEDEDFAEELVVREVVASQDNRIRWIYFVLGCAVLMPWNALITATPYFLSRLEGSSYKSTFSSYLSVSFTVANFAILGHATATSKQSSTTRRSLLSMSWLCFLTFMLALSTYVHTSPGLFVSFVLLNGIAQAIAGSYLQTSVVAVASLFGPTALQAMMSGQAAVGVAVSGVQVISAAASTRGIPTPQAVDAGPEEKSAFVFFSLSTLFLLASGGAYMWLIGLPSYKSVVGTFVSHSRAPSGQVLHPDEGQRLAGEASVSGTTVIGKKEQIMRVAKANWVYNAAVAYVFVVTLAVFPPITVSVQPTNPATHPLLFSAIHFFVFNTGDFIGRSICSFPRLLVWSANRILTLALLRTLFIPLFLMCNIQRSSYAPTTSGAVISSDVVFMLILLAFGISNGYVCSLGMMAAPSVEHNPRLKGRVEDVDVAATVATFCLVGGLALGSVASFAVRAAVCECNPFRN